LRSDGDPVCREKNKQKLLKKEKDIGGERIEGECSLEKIHFIEHTFPGKLEVRGGTGKKCGTGERGPEESITEGVNLPLGKRGGA